MITIGLRLFKYHPEVAMSLQAAQVLFIFAFFFKKYFNLDVLGSKSKALISYLAIVIILHGQVYYLKRPQLKSQHFQGEGNRPRENAFVQGPKTLSNALRVDSESCL